MQTGKIICYDRVDGSVCGLMPIGNQWWKATRDEKFESLDESYIRYDEDSELMYLCEEGATLHITDLTVMMGCALENAYGDIHEELDQRLNTLKAQGIMVSEEPRRLDLMMRIYHNVGTLRKGAYSIVCEDRKRTDRCLLNCSTLMCNNMFREMRDHGVIVRVINAKGKAVWQLPSAQTSSDASTVSEFDLFDQIAADQGVSPSS